MNNTRQFARVITWFTFLNFVTHLTALAQSTAFTYQGRLGKDGTTANGSFNLTFALFDDATNGDQIGDTITNNAVPVTDGLFTVALDFGMVFDGTPLWVEIGVETNGESGFTTLSPRQALTPSPYAITAANLAGTVASGQLSGEYANTLTFDNPGNVFAGDGSMLANVDALTLDGFSAGNLWQLGGNAGTVAGPDFLGTTDSQPLEFHVNNLRALRLELNSTSGAPNVIGGSPTNFVDAGIVGAFIGGGGATNFIGSHYVNHVSSSWGSIVGGGNNNIQTSANFSTIGGGFDNTIFPSSIEATIGGGFGNSIFNSGVQSTIGGGLGNQIGSQYSVISGGFKNVIQSGADQSFIGGGSSCAIGANSFVSTIAGGDGNQIGTNSPWSAISGGRANMVANNTSNAFIGGGASNSATGYGSTVPGGYLNYAEGSGSFAAGAMAAALGDNSFAWGDGTEYVAAGPKEFLVRAHNGMYLSATPLYVDESENVFVSMTVGFQHGYASPYELELHFDSAGKPNGGSWANTSDARIKKNIQSLTGALDKLVQLRGVSFEWINPQDHANQTRVQSGFIAQEVERVFPDWVTQIPAGDHDKSLTPDGKVRSLSLPFAYDALVVEALKELRAEKDAAIRDLKAENQKLEQQLAAQQTASVRAEARLADLERMVARLSEKSPLPLVDVTRAAPK